MSARDKTPDRRVATLGEAFIWHGAARKVEAKSDGKNGKWVCISCGEPLAHNLEKDLHCARRRPAGLDHMPGGVFTRGERAKHVLAWFSFESNRYEVP